MIMVTKYRLMVSALSASDQAYLEEIGIFAGRFMTEIDWERLLDTSDLYYYYQHMNTIITRSIIHVTDTDQFDFFTHYNRIYLFD